MGCRTGGSRALEQEAVVAVDCDGEASSCEVDADARHALGSLSIVAEVNLEVRPRSRAVIASRWDLEGENRSFELGIDESQYPYLLVSQDGQWGEGHAFELQGRRQLALGTTYEVSAVFELGKRAALYVDGVRVATRTDVFGTLHPSDADLSLGKRIAASELPLEGQLERVWLFDRSLDEEELGRLTRAHGHCQGPRPLPPARAITRGPRHHWFGYYDKLQFSPDDRYVLGMAVDFEGRSPEDDDILEIGMVDLEDNDTWITLGQSQSWGWQQGCMLQWIPGADNEIIWNDREGEGDDARFVAHIMDVDTKDVRTIPHPIYTLAPDGKTALSLDFHRLEDMRPGYGYKGIIDPHRDENHPEEAGIYRIDLESGDSELIVSLADLAAVPHDDYDFDEVKGWVNVLLVNPSGSQFFFLHRWRRPSGGFDTRVLTANMDGSELFMLTDVSRLSHIDWRSDTEIVIFTRHYEGYALFEDGEGYVETLLHYPRDGHQTFLPDTAWMLSDTYPDDNREQHPFLYHLPSNELFALGHFRSPAEYRGEVRCDNHPRHSRDGTKVVIDSPHDGGRQMYLIEVDALLDDVNEK